MYNKRLLLFFEQYFTVRLGENLYQYDVARDNLSFIRAWTALALAWMKQMLRKNHVDPRIEKKARHIFYVETINQRNAVHAFLQKMNKHDVLLILNDDINKVPLGFDGFESLHVSGRKLYFSALLYLPRALAIAGPLVRKYPGKISRHHIYINLALFLSAVNFFESMLNRYEPASATVINDHNLYPLALVFAARYSQTVSIYVQHAAVSDAFPKLLVNVALLEGQQAKDTYDRLGNYAGKCMLVGIPRLDGYLGIRKDFAVKKELTIGLCLKTFYTRELIANSIAALKKSSRTGRLVLRPHPGSPAQFWDEIREHGVDISDSRVEDAATFLGTVDVLISGESTIILEAALMKIPAIYFDDGSFFYPFDLYGFVKNKVAYCHIQAPADFTKTVDEIDFRLVEENFRNSQYYCSTVNTGFQNRSWELIADFYKSIG